MKHSETYGFLRARQTSALAAKISLLIASGKKDKAARTLTHGLYQLGGVYIKYLQLGATLTPKFPGLDDDLRAKVFDKVDCPNLDIQRILLEQLGPAYRDQLSSISAEPFAGGSFASAYSAMHRDGSEVVIKVLRPHLKRQLRGDLRLLGLLVRSIQPFFRSDLINFTRMYREFRQTVWRETDYPQEVENALSLEDQYQHDPHIYIPKTYTSLCSPMIIVQERLFGVPLSEVLTKKLKGVEAQQYVKNMLGSDLNTQLAALGASQIAGSMTGPFIHGDIHPGNVFLLPNNKVGLIDFGVRLQPVPSPHAMYDVMQDNYRMAEGEDIEISDHITRVFRLYNEKVFLSMERISRELESRGVNLDIVRELRGMIAKIAEPSVARIQDSYRNGRGIPVAMLLETINHDNQFALTTNEAIARITRTHALFWQTVFKIDLAQEVSRLVHQRIRKIITDNPEALGAKPEAPSFGEAVEIFSDWYSQLVERNPLVFGPMFANMRLRLDKYTEKVKPVDA